MITDKNMCSGCGACYNICPQNCINMEEDEEGFLYPKIDNEKCINCGKCKKVCPINKEYKGKTIGKAFACYNKNTEERLKSSSGGIFCLLAKYVVDNEGIVFGAALDKLVVKHIKITKEDEIWRLQGSKYVQSDVGNTFKEVKKYLSEGRLVLFSGTPCQINGLNCFLDKEYSNLVMVDVICHGVPSPLVWQKYLSCLNVINNDNVNINFRDKESGWKSYSFSISYKSRKKFTEVFYENSYMRAFLNNLTLRKSCYNCHSKSKEKISDITLADFWGINSVDSTMNDDKGISLMLVNTNKGRDILKKIENKILIKEVDFDNAVSHNKSIYESAEMPNERNYFFEDLKKEAFINVVNKYLPQERFHTIKSTIRKMKRLIKRIILK